MSFDLQKASFWKRASAAIFDGILVGILAVGLAWILSLILNYDSYNTTLTDAYAHYESQYGITFEITQEAYEAMAEEELARYNEAYDALIADDEAMYAYNMVINLTLVVTSLGILLSFLILEFAVPLLLGNGQTLGKKIFGIGLIRPDGVQMNHMQLFIRTVLGKFTVETMIPVYVLIMLMFNSVGLPGTVLLMALALTQVILLVVHRNHAVIHDLLAGTVAVDLASQMVFRTTDDLIAYQKKVAAEQAARQSYF